MNRYKYNFLVKCPNDRKDIPYTIIIHHSELILVEDVISACDINSGYQEDIADILRAALPGNQKITGIHQGVLVVTTR